MACRREFLSAALAAGLSAATGPALAAQGKPRPRGRTGTGETVDGHPVVETASGRLRGFDAGGITTFLGIPYGAPTAGDNRFMPPRPPLKWTGVRDALFFGPQVPFRSPAFASVGTEEFGFEDPFLLYRNWTPHVTGEDSLRLNVWAPARREKLPVMVYMHGGGLVGGSGNDLLGYYGRNLAERGDVIVVTHNHRLNLFGYLDLSSFGGRWRDTSNIGMLDIVAVLRWVRDNIKQFGGDPGNVTIFGQSGGGMKVSALMAMPAARGLFRRGIVQSGSPAILPAYTAEQARAQTDRILGQLGIGAGDLDRLGTMTAEQLAVANNSSSITDWRMTIGGPSIPVQPGGSDPLAQSVPLMVGTNLNEFVAGVDNWKAGTYSDTDLEADARAQFGGGSSEIVAAYRRAHPNRRPFELWGAIQCAFVRDAAARQTQNNFAVTGKSWHYLFQWATPVLDGRPGTFHSAEIAFVFNNADLCENQTGGGPRALSMAHRMSDAWISFARTGDPNHSDLPAWPVYGNVQTVMSFDDVCRAAPDGELAGRRLVERSGKGGIRMTGALPPHAG